MSNILPNALIQRLGNDPFFDQEAFLAAHQDDDLPTSIRINPEKPCELLFPVSEKVPWCETGFYLPDRPNFALDPLFHAGGYYIQEASSMFLAHIVKELALDGVAIRALDCCAAPGGKSTLLNTTLSKSSLLVANEMMTSRAQALRENHVRWGAANVVVTNNDASAFKRLPGFFDLVLVDAPSSGSSRFNGQKNEDSESKWSEDTVQLCYERQQRILAAVIESLARHGHLIYSTSSYTQQENEDILDWLMEEYSLESVQIPLDPHWQIQETRSVKHRGYGYRFYPHQTKGQGLFISVLRSTANQTWFSTAAIKMESQLVGPNQLQDWIRDYQRFETLVHQEHVHFFPVEQGASIHALRQVLNLKNVGTIAGKWLGKELVPAHDLAMSVNQHQDLPTVELAIDDARNFSRNTTLNADLFYRMKAGWTLVKFRGVSLGWVKS